MSRRTHSPPPPPAAAHNPFPTSPQPSLSNPLAYLAYLGHWRGQLLVSLFVVGVCGVVFALQGPVGRWRTRRKEVLAKRRQFEILSMEAEKKRQGGTGAAGQGQGAGKVGGEKKEKDREREKDKEADGAAKKGKKDKKRGHGATKSTEGLAEVAASSLQTPQQRARALSRGSNPASTSASASASRKSSAVRQPGDRSVSADSTQPDPAEASSSVFQPAAGRSRSRIRAPSLLITEADSSSAPASAPTSGLSGTPEPHSHPLPASPSSSNLSALGEESASVASWTDQPAAGPSRRSSVLNDGFSIIPEKGYLPASTEALLNGSATQSGASKKKRTKSRTDGTPSTPPPASGVSLPDDIGSPSPRSGRLPRSPNGVTQTRPVANGFGHARKQSYSGQGAKSMADLDELLAGSEERIDRLRAEVGAAKAEEAKAKTELREIKDGLFAGSATAGMDERERATLLAQRYRALRSDYTDVYAHISTLETIIRTAGLPVPMRTHLPDPAAHTGSAQQQRKHSLPPRSPLSFGLGGEAYALDRQASTSSGPAAVPPPSSAAGGTPGPSRRHSHAVLGTGHGGFLTADHPPSPFLSPLPPTGINGPYLSAYPHLSPLQPGFQPQLHHTARGHTPQHSPLPVHPSQLQSHLAAAAAAGMGYPYAPAQAQAYRSSSASASGARYYPSPTLNAHHFAGPLTPGTVHSGTASPLPPMEGYGYPRSGRETYEAYEGAHDIYNVPGLPIGSAQRSRSVSDLRGRSGADNAGTGLGAGDGATVGSGQTMDRERKASIELSVLKKKPQAVPVSALERMEEDGPERVEGPDGVAGARAEVVVEEETPGLGIGGLDGVRSDFTGLVAGHSDEDGDVVAVSVEREAEEADEPEGTDGSATSSSHPASPSPGSNKTHRLLTPNSAELYTDGGAMKGRQSSADDVDVAGEDGEGEESDDTVPAGKGVLGQEGGAGDAEVGMEEGDGEATVRFKEGAERGPVFASLSNTTEQNLGRG